MWLKKKGNAGKPNLSAGHPHWASLELQVWDWLNQEDQQTGFSVFPPVALLFGRSLYFVVSCDYKHKQGNNLRCVLLMEENEKTRLCRLSGAD
jgi:hypothetical protein